MGNSCITRELRNSANEATGLTTQEMKLIRNLWYSIVDTWTFKEIGALFFMKLFEKHPYMQGYFAEFVDQDRETLKSSRSLRAHGISVFTDITAYVDYMDDDEIFEALIHKRVGSHFKRGVMWQDMENFTNTLLEFMEDVAPGNPLNVQKALAAWEKLMMVHNCVYRSRVDSIMTTTMLTTDIASSSTS